MERGDKPDLQVLLEALSRLAHITVADLELGAVLAERDALQVRLAEVETQAAAMRGALEAVRREFVMDDGYCHRCERFGGHADDCTIGLVDAALSSSAGRETAERTKRLEAAIGAARDMEVVVGMFLGGLISKERVKERRTELFEALCALDVPKGGEAR